MPKKKKNDMASGQERSELDTRAEQGETVVPGGTGGKSLEAQEHLAEGKPICVFLRVFWLSFSAYMIIYHAIIYK